MAEHKAVPIRPTQAMLDAACRNVSITYPGRGYQDHQQPITESEARRVWASMVGAAPAGVAGTAEADSAVFEELGRAMYAMTTTVHSPNIPFAEACAAIPGVWENYMNHTREREARAAGVAGTFNDQQKGGQ